MTTNGVIIMIIIIYLRVKLDNLLGYSRPCTRGRPRHGERQTDGLTDLQGVHHKSIDVQTDITTPCSQPAPKAKL